MKKLIYLILVLSSFISCSSDENTDTPNDNNLLVGTSWKGRHMEDLAFYYKYTFNDKSECIVEYSNFEDFRNSAKNNRLYELKNNNLIIKSIANETLIKGILNPSEEKIYFDNRYGTPDIFLRIK